MTLPYRLQNAIDPSFGLLHLNLRPRNHDNTS